MGLLAVLPTFARLIYLLRILPVNLCSGLVLAFELRSWASAQRLAAGECSEFDDGATPTPHGCIGRLGALVFERVRGGCPDVHSAHRALLWAQTLGTALNSARCSRRAA
jgi:hypothetical protein